MRKDTNESEKIAAALRKRAKSIREVIDSKHPDSQVVDLVSLMMISVSEEFDRLADELTGQEIDERRGVV